MQLLGFGERGARVKRYGLEVALNHLLIPETETLDDHLERQLYTRFITKREPRYELGILDDQESRARQIMVRRQWAKHIRSIPRPMRKALRETMQRELLKRHPAGAR